MVEYPARIHEKAQSTSSRERTKAIVYINNNIRRLDDIISVWEDLHRLTQDKDDEVRRHTTFALGWAFASVPDKNEAWEDIHRLTQGEEGSIRQDIAGALERAFENLPMHLIRIRRGRTCTD